MASRLWLYVFSVHRHGPCWSLPTLIVIPMSFSDSQYLEFPPRGLVDFRWYDALFRLPRMDERPPKTSLKAPTFLTMLAATPMGVPWRPMGMHRLAN